MSGVKPHYRMNRRAARSPSVFEEATEDRRFDLHMHSNRSDGTDAPADVVQKAKAAGLTLMALTDHDTLDGVAEAMRMGETVGVKVLSGVEMDTEWPGEMHILGLDVDPENETLQNALMIARQRRNARNQMIFDRLRKAGYDVQPYVKGAEGNVTRLHIALALVEAGYAAGTSEAFRRYLLFGCPGYCVMERFTPAEAISVIRAASGVPVWAHPFHSGGNVHSEIKMLLSAGLMGVEAYHPSATAGQSRTLLSLARQNGLLVTCGSDSHGAYRSSASPGCTWRDTKRLNATYDFFMRRHDPTKTE